MIPLLIVSQDRNSVFNAHNLPCLAVVGSSIHIVCYGTADNDSIEIAGYDSPDSASNALSDFVRAYSDGLRVFNFPEELTVPKTVTKKKHK